MKQKTKNKTLIVCFILVSLMLSGCITGSYVLENEKNEPLQEVSVRLPWFVTGTMTGFLTAKAKGFYEEEGLKVTNHPGGVDIPTIQLVASGNDLIGILPGAESIILARANNIPIKAIAVLDKKSPYVFYSLKQLNTPKDFEGKTVSVAFGRPLEIVYRVLLKKEDIDTSTITEVKKILSDIPLFSGKVDIKPAFYDSPIRAADKVGVEINVLRPGDYGINSYGYTVFVTEDTIKNKPELIIKYLKATFKGWEYAVENPEESVRHLLSQNPNLNRETELKIIKARREYSFPEDATTPIGWMDKKIWQEMHDNLLEQELLEEPLNIDDVYTNEFLEMIHSE